ITRANPCCIIPYPQEPNMTQSPGDQFERLLEIMRRLREPGGCPWDREQTRTSLKPFLIEETYEVLEAIESGDTAALQEELGDLLFQVVFHAQIAVERGEFDMAALLARLADKMISRHPHVFGEATVGTPREALVQWEAIKQREAHTAGRRRSVIDGVPRALPSLLRAQRITSKASRVNFDWPDARAAWTKVEEECREAADALAADDRTRPQDGRGGRHQAQGRRHHRGRGDAPGTGRGWRGTAHPGRQPPGDPRHPRGRDGSRPQNRRGGGRARDTGRAGRGGQTPADVHRHACPRHWRRPRRAGRGRRRH